MNKCIKPYLLWNVTDLPMPFRPLGLECLGKERNISFYRGIKALSKKSNCQEMNGLSAFSFATFVVCADCEQ